MNRLYYGDNLDVLRRHVEDESVDLVYLDPPFNSNASYLHCDPTASHYLKILLDGVFGPQNFRNEIIWKRTSAHSAAKRWNVVHDVLLFYSKSDDCLWNNIQVEHSEEYEARFKRYLSTGQSIQDVVTDIPPLNSQAAERLGYPTQKPEALLDRIIAASSNEGDIVLDPFCGCGTTIASAQKLKRQWIGIDITNLAITLIRSRLTDTFAGTVEYEVIGEPVSLPDAARLAADDPYQFQWWALGLVGARPVEEKKGADKGIDGRIYFHVGDGRTRQIILSVKAGHVTVSQVRDLRGVLDREKADMGVLISLEEPTGPMRKEAASAGFYDSPWGRHGRLQLVGVEDLLTGRTIDRPPIQTSTTFKRAPKAAPKVHERRPLDFGRPDPEEPS